MFNLRGKLGQSTAEYAVVLSLVVAAVIAMQVYVKRGMQGRLKSGTDTLNMPESEITLALDGTNSITANIASLRQYEPYYLESSYSTYSENIEQETIASDGSISKQKTSDLQARQAGGYQRQTGPDNFQSANDTAWRDNFGGD